MPAPKVTSIKKTPPKLPVKVGGKQALTVKRVPKDFKVVDWDRVGRKVILYADSGMGKTTLAMLLNNPVFIGTDDGGGVMRHPVTGAKVKVVEGIEDFFDVRDALASDVFDPYDEIVVDTITEVERWSIPYILATIKKAKSDGGGEAEHLEDYGWHKGYRHRFEAMEMLLSDLDRWVRKGKTVVLLAQSNAAKINNDGGGDYLKVAPDLYHAKSESILNLVTQWCDHIFRINYTNLKVDKQKKVSSTEQRAVYIHGSASFMAKSRTISQDYPCVEFKDKEDDSIWRLLNDH